MHLDLSLLFFQVIALIYSLLSQQAEHSAQSVNRMYEEQMKQVARQSSTKRESVRQAESPERPCRDIVQPNYPVPTHFSSPLSAPIDPPVRYNAERRPPVSALDTRGSHGYAGLNSSSFGLRSDVEPNLEVRPLGRAPITRGLHGYAGLYSSSSDLHSNVEPMIGVPAYDISTHGKADFLKRPKSSVRSPSPPPRNPSGNLTRQDETRECRICNKMVTEPLKTPCNHVFCRICIKRWLKCQPMCPLSACQKDINEEGLEPAL